MRSVPKFRNFLDMKGKPQRNLPIEELDELWEIPNEYGDIEHLQKKLEGEVEVPPQKIIKVKKVMDKYSQCSRHQNALKDDDEKSQMLHIKYVFPDNE